MKLRCISAPRSWSHVDKTVALTIATFQHIQCLYLTYTEVAWVLISSETQVQPQIIPDPDYLPDYLPFFYDYDIINTDHTLNFITCVIQKQFFPNLLYAPPMLLKKGLKESSFICSNINVHISKLRASHLFRQSFEYVIRDECIICYVA